MTGAFGRAVGVAVGRLQLHALVLAAHLERRTRLTAASAPLTWLTCRRARARLPSPRRTGFRGSPGRSPWCGRRRRRPCIRRTGPCGRSWGFPGRCGRTVCHTSHPCKTAAGQRTPAWNQGGCTWGSLTPPGRGCTDHRLVACRTQSRSLWCSCRSSIGQLQQHLTSGRGSG